MKLVKNKVDRQIWGQVIRQIDNHVEKQVIDYVGNKLNGDIWEPVRRQVKEHVWREVTDNIVDGENI